MIDSEYSTDDYEFFQVSIGAVIKNPEMLIFLPDHLKIKECVKMLLKSFHS